MLKNIHGFWMVVLAAVLLPGCFMGKETFIPVKYYDIGNPVTSKSTGFQVKTGAFTVIGPYRQEMIFRTEKNELLKDSYSRWALSPDVMLRRYLMLAFADSKGGTDYTISGSILSFEADLSTKEAVFTVEYSIGSSDSKAAASVERTSTFRRKIDGTGAEAFAGAMSAAVAEFAVSVADDMEKISKKTK